MNGNASPSDRATNSDLVLRSLSFGYIGLLIVLPIIAMVARSLEGGLSGLWADMTLPPAIYSLKLTISTALIMAAINVVTGTATAWVLVRYSFPGKNMMNALIDLPFAMPTIVTGIMLVAVYGPKSMIGAFLNRYGIEIMFNKPGIIIALLFVTFPFVEHDLNAVSI